MLARASLVFGLSLAVCACASQPSAERAPDRAEFVREIGWHATGQWIAADLHTHTTFSDGGHTPIEVAQKAVQFGCRVLAITDHGDHNLRAATPEYAAAIAGVRRQFPELITVAGLEWNVPPYAGREHVGILVPSGAAEQRTLAVFKEKFDDYKRPDHETLSAEAGLTWLGEQSGGAVRPVVIYNHPSRKDDGSLENIGDVEKWRRVNDLLIGFEGAPGHQHGKTIGGYENAVKTVNRWDPVAGKVGDAWDQILGTGVDLSAALASSDLHNAREDSWPCEFSETRLFVPEPTIDGVLRALRAGAMYAGHGRFVSAMTLTVRANGLSRPAMIGESIRVPAGTPVSARIKVDVAGVDWQRRPGHVSTVQLVGVTPHGASVVREWKDGTLQPEVEVTLDIPAGGMTVRVVVSRDEGANQPAMMYLTNPIRISTL